MKKHLLISIFALIAVFANAQTVCTPDTQTVPGVYPDSATGLPTVYVGTAYSKVITLVVAADTSGTFPIIGQATITYDQIFIKNWDNPTSLNLPPNFNAACEPPGCVFPGASKGCILLTGLVTDPADTGDYNLTLDLEVKFKNVPILGTYTQDDGTEDADYNDDYILKVVAPSGTNENLRNSFDVSQNTPNPFARKTNISFTNDKAENVSFHVYNMLGEIVYSQIIFANEGANKFQFSAAGLPSGIYSYSLDNGSKTISKRMILMEN